MIRLLLLIFLIPTAHASKLFIEPGVFVNMMDGAQATYNDGSNHYKGTMRNTDLSYALKFGLHFGHFEFGLESELYNFTGHFDGKGSGDFTKEAQITYNSLFVGYEFIPHQYIYLAISGRPYMKSGSDTFVEHHNVLSLEYSYHIKDWVSFNFKMETASELDNGATNKKEFTFKDLLLVGFSFPITAEY
jgi:hypothetical protein